MGGQISAEQPNKLTLKQQAFAIAFVETGNQSEAYRRAYEASDMLPTTIAKRASELMRDGDVAGMIAELRADAILRHQITVDDLLDELEDARIAAMSAEIPQASAAVSATLGKAKLLGLLVDKLDARVLTASLPVKVDDLI